MGTNRLSGVWQTGRCEAETAAAAGAFVMWPMACAAMGWQWQVYQAAYEEARAVVRPLPPILAGVRSAN